MGKSKIIFGNQTLMDLTSDTVDAQHLAQGYTAHDASGTLITGTMKGGGSMEGYFNPADDLFYEESTYTTPITGSSGVIYVSLDTDKTYRYNGSIFVRLDEEGGHTIVNSSGTNMTARSKLRFNTGLTVADDSANNQTVVNVIGGSVFVFTSTFARAVGKIVTVTDANSNTASGIIDSNGNCTVFVPFIGSLTVSVNDTSFIPIEPISIDYFTRVERALIFTSEYDEDNISYSEAYGKANQLVSDGEISYNATVMIVNKDPYYTYSSDFINMVWNNMIHYPSGQIGGMYVTTITGNKLNLHFTKHGFIVWSDVNADVNNMREMSTYQTAFHIKEVNANTDMVIPKTYSTWVSFYEFVE